MRFRTYHHRSMRAFALLLSVMMALSSAIVLAETAEPPQIADALANTHAGRSIQVVLIPQGEGGCLLSAKLLGYEGLVVDTHWQYRDVQKGEWISAKNGNGLQFPLSGGEDRLDAAWRLAAVVHGYTDGTETLGSLVEPSKSIVPQDRLSALEAVPSLTDEPIDGVAVEPTAQTPEAVDPDPSAPEQPADDEPAVEPIVIDEAIADEPEAVEPEPDEIISEEPEAVEPEKIVPDEPTPETHELINPEPESIEPEVIDPEPESIEPEVIDPEPEPEEFIANEPVSEQPEFIDPDPKEIVPDQPLVETPKALEPAPEVIEPEPLEPVPAPEAIVPVEPVPEAPAAPKAAEQTAVPSAPAKARTATPALQQVPDPDGPYPGIPIKELIDEQYPDRRIIIYAYWGEKETLSFGDDILFSAELLGYDGLEYQLRWQCLKSPDAEWEDIEGETSPQYTYTLAEESLLWNWRVAVDITGIE